MRDIVYCLKEKLPREGQELRWSLRSLKNLPHGKVWMYTPRLPEWVNEDKVGHIPCEQGASKYEDLTAKWKSFPDLDQLPQKIYYMDDDFYIVKPVRDSKPFFNGSMKNIAWVTRKNAERSLGKDVSTAFNNTYQLFLRMGMPDAKSPRQHVPYPLTRRKIPLHWDDGGGPYDWKSLHFNYEHKAAKFKFGETKMRTAEELARLVDRGEVFLSTDDGMHINASGMDRLLDDLFPDPCKYEK